MVAISPRIRPALWMAKQSEMKKFSDNYWMNQLWRLLRWGNKLLYLHVNLRLQIQHPLMDYHFLLLSKPKPLFLAICRYFYLYVNLKYVLSKTELISSLNKNQYPCYSVFRSQSYSFTFLWVSSHGWVSISPLLLLLQSHHSGSDTFSLLIVHAPTTALLWVLVIQPETTENLLLPSSLHCSGRSK